jgi:hypothetical protein
MKKEKKYPKCTIQTYFLLRLRHSCQNQSGAIFLDVHCGSSDRKKGRIQSTATNSINCHSPPIWEEEEEEAEPTIQTCAYGRF